MKVPGLVRAVVVASCLALDTPAAAQIDMTGLWSVTLDETIAGTSEATFTQSGSALSSPEYGSGTIDPSTGEFMVSAATSCEQPLPPFVVEGTFVLSGTVSPDGLTFVGGWSTIVLYPGHFQCGPLSGAATGERILGCGNGILEPGEECDTRSPFFDCCTDTCQLQAAGTLCRPFFGDACDIQDTCDGVSETCPDQIAPAGTQCRAPADACDVGEFCTGTSIFCPDATTPDADGDGIGDLCDLCPGSARNAVLVKPRLGVASYDAVAGNDKLSLKAELPLSSATAVFLDPVVDGMEVAIGTAGEPGSLEATLPPGAYDPTTGQGWSVAKSGRKWSFRGTDALLPVTKATVKLVVDRRGPRAAVRASGNRRSFADTLPAAPLSLGLILDPPRATSLTCGGVAFSDAGGARPACELRAHGTALSCR